MASATRDMDDENVASSLSAELFTGIRRLYDNTISEFEFNGIRIVPTLNTYVIAINAIYSKATMWSQLVIPIKFVSKR